MFSAAGAPFCASSSKVQLQRNLNHSGVARRGANCSVTCCGNAPAWIRKVGVVEHIKNSVRHSMLIFSRIGIILLIEKSRLFWLGPRSKFRLLSPNKSPLRTNAAVLKYLFKRSCVRPELCADSIVAPGAQLARLLEGPYSAAPLVSRILNGVPLCRMVTPANCHPPKRRLPTAVSFRPYPQFGTWYEKFSTNRFVLSKSEGPRFKLRRV